jgi:hypothetical protein
VATVAFIGYRALLRVYCESCSVESVTKILEAAQRFVLQGSAVLSDPICVEAKGLLFDMDEVLISSIGSVVRC